MCIRVSSFDCPPVLINCSYKGGVMHYLVAVSFRDRKLTVNGEMFFDNLPALVEVSDVDA